MTTAPTPRTECGCECHGSTWAVCPHCRPDLIEAAPAAGWVEPGESRFGEIEIAVAPPAGLDVDRLAKAIIRHINHTLSSHVDPGGCLGSCSEDIAAEYEGGGRIMDGPTSPRPPKAG